MAAGRWPVNVRLVAGGLALGLVAGVALTASLAPYDPIATDTAHVLEPPRRAHPFGTDDLGRDILSRVMHGARISLAVGVASVALAAAAGVPIGLAAGYWRRLDDPCMRLMDLILAFPAVILALAIVAAVGPSLGNVMAAIAFVNIPVFARLARGQTLTLREREYVTAARALGQRDGWIVARHILPNASAALIVQASLSIAFAILAEASLSFLGLGVQPPLPAWGSMLSLARGYTELAPWLAIFPGLAIFVTVIGFNVLGDGLRDVLDPTVRRG
ncbi:MAG: ABC transporter permease [Candidatus Rokubacteria bacterium]|nr:ABC transporter permease [Candidatus Rokubacteria bacterium]